MNSLKAGVVGYPIKHSKSPVLHGHWLDRYGINGSYIRIELSPEKFADGIQDLIEKGFRGVNVTIPHKEKALEIANSVTDRAALIGAANTLYFHADGTIGADNTDGYGFIQNLHQNAPHWQPSAGPALVLGAGGAARAVISAFIDAGVPEIRLTNRTKIRAENLADHFGARVKVIDWHEQNSAVIGANTIVNSTSLGMEGQGELMISLDNASPYALATDIVYTPLETPFLQRAKQAGLQCVDGLGMLLHQAAPGFENWFGHKPEVDDELRNAVLNG